MNEIKLFFCELSHYYICVIIKLLLILVSHNLIISNELFFLCMCSKII